MTGPADGVLSIDLGPFNDPAQEVEGINFVIHYNDDTWDNNNGNDYFIPIAELQSCDHPTNVNTTVNGPNSATLDWDPVDGAIAYQVQGKRVGSSVVSLLIQNGDTEKTVNGLMQSSTYKWRVRAICSESLFSSWSGVSTFSTPAGRFVDPSLTVWPNPADEEVNVVIRDANSETVRVTLISTDGRMLRSGYANASGQITFRLEDLAPGLYFIRMEGEVPVTKNLIIR
jgi:hypothetical protein